jgi:hypothetical protein
VNLDLTVGLWETPNESQRARAWRCRRPATYSFLAVATGRGARPGP